MRARLNTLLFGTLRRQLILSVALVHAVMMTLFIWDLTVRQQDMLLERQGEHAKALAHSIATTSAGVLAARDYHGLQEIIEAQRRYPELRYAMAVDQQGRIVAHSEPARIGQYVTDLPKQSDARAKPDIASLHESAELVDVAAPIMLAGRQIGWARVGIGQQAIGARLAAITRDGILYALGAILVGSILAGAMGLRLTRRLAAIERVTDAVRAGQTDRRANVGGIDEAARLGQAVNEMLDTLANRENALRASEGRFRTLVETSPLPMLIVDNSPDNRIELLNRQFNALFGYDRDDVWDIHSWWRRAYPDADYRAELQERWRQGMEAMAGAGEKRLGPFPARITGKDGQEHVCEIYMGVTDEHGLVVFHDITERQRMEDTLRKLSLAVEQSPNTILITDLDARIEYVNRTFTEVTGYGPEEAIGNNPRLLRSGQTPPETYAQMWERLDAGLSWQGELINRRKDGSIYVEHAQISPIRQPDGRISHYLAIKSDITEKKAAEAELERYRQNLEQLVGERTRELERALTAAENANQAKSVFLANMSHELRTPLNAILGFARLMADADNLDETQRRNLGTINSSGEHLLALINDILEISRIESGRLSLNPQPCDLHELLATLVEALTPRARDKGIELRFEPAPDLPRYILADAGKLRQILLNLLANAVKYTPRGGVVLSVSRISPAVEGETVELRFEVRDTGIGIAQEDLARVFDPFYQTAQGIAQGEGTGLGLAICHQYAELMHGRLSAESVLGTGSVFRFQFEAPLAASTAAPSGQGGPSRLVPGHPPCRILVAEDNPDSRQLMLQLLERAGFEVLCANDGKAAVKLFQTWTPDAILMDMRMPEMDGYEATRAIRALPGGGKLPIVAITASAFEEDRPAILAVGCDEVLKKPLQPETLFLALARLLPLRFEPETAPAATAPASDTVDLSRLPEDVRARLDQAAVLLDSTAIHAIAEEIRADYPDIAAYIERQADSYRYDLLTG